MIWVGGELLEPQLFDGHGSSYLSCSCNGASCGASFAQQIGNAALLIAIEEAASYAMRDQSGNASNE